MASKVLDWRYRRLCLLSTLASHGKWCHHPTTSKEPMPTAYGKQMQVLNQGMASSELELVLLPDENPLLIFYHLHKVPKAHCLNFKFHYWMSTILQNQIFHLFTQIKRRLNNWGTNYFLMRLSPVQLGSTSGIPSETENEDKQHGRIPVEQPLTKQEC